MTDLTSVDQPEIRWIRIRKDEPGRSYRGMFGIEGTVVGHVHCQPDLDEFWGWHVAAVVTLDQGEDDGGEWRDIVDLQVDEPGLALAGHEWSKQAAKAACELAMRKYLTTRKGTS